MFERMSSQARRVVVDAQGEARALGHDHLGTEHLLLGLLDDPDSVGSRVLIEIGVDVDKLRGLVIQQVGEGGPLPAGNLAYTPRAKKVLELALREALQLGHDYIGSEHLLLALLREGEGVAAGVLADAGVQLSEARHAIIRVLHDQQRPPVAAGEPGGQARVSYRDQVLADIDDRRALGQANRSRPNSALAELYDQLLTVAVHVKQLLES